MARFDPDAARERLLTRDLDAYLRIATRKRALSPIDIASWGAILPCVIEAFAIGIDAEPRVSELLDTVLDRLHPDRWVAHWTDARTASSGDLAWGWATLAIARWLKTGELQSELFARTVAVDREYFERTTGRQARWRLDAVDRFVVRMCIGEAFADVLALFARPQLTTLRDLGPAQADRSAILGHTFAQHVMTKRYSSDDLADAAERTLAAGVSPLLDHHHLQTLAELAYLTSMQIGGGDDARIAFARLPSYLRT